MIITPGVAYQNSGVGCQGDHAGAANHESVFEAGLLHALPSSIGLPEDFLFPSPLLPLLCGLEEAVDCGFADAEFIADGFEAHSGLVEPHHLLPSHGGTRPSTDPPL